jgi:hypothetical protein
LWLWRSRVVARCGAPYVANLRRCRCRCRCRLAAVSQRRDRQMSALLGEPQTAACKACKTCQTCQTAEDGLERARTEAHAGAAAACSSLKHELRRRSHSASWRQRASAPHSAPGRSRVYGFSTARDPGCLTPLSRETKCRPSSLHSPAPSLFTSGRPKALCRRHRTTKL